MRTIVTILGLLSVSMMPASAQDKVLLETIEGMPTLDGVVLTYFPEGSHDRASEVQALMEDGVAYFDSTLEVELFVHVALLGPEEWKRLNTPPAPYSLFLPGVAAGPPHIMFLPAERGHALDSLVMKINRESASLQRMAPSSDELSLRYSALVGFHELGHVVARAYELEAPSSWFNEFLATFLAYAFLRDQSPQDARIWHEVTTSFVEEIEPTKIALEDIHSGVGVQNYLWYQGSLQVRVDEVYRRQGLAFISQLKSFFASPSSVGDSPDDFLHTLEGISPGFESWAKKYH